MSSNCSRMQGETHSLENMGWEVAICLTSAAISSRTA